MAKVSKNTRYHVVRPDGVLGQGYEKEQDAHNEALSFDPAYGVLAVTVPSRDDSVSDAPKE